MYTLAMAGADLILGIQQLIGLGEVVWNLCWNGDEIPRTLEAGLGKVEEDAKTKTLKG